MSVEVFANAFSLLCAQGLSRAAVAQSMLSPLPLQDREVLIGGGDAVVARLPAGLICEDKAQSRTNLILSALLDQLEWDAHGVAPDRIGVVIGTSTSGISEAPLALRQWRALGGWPAGFEYGRQTLGDGAAFVANRLGAQGPHFSVSTACTSGAKAIISAARLLKADLADVVVCGGVDSLSQLTLNGFAALDSVSRNGCRPFSRARDGITLGEGGALFVLSRSSGPWRLLGWGETSDAHHISAPDPVGAGAEAAVREALSRAGLRPADIGHVHLHGTGTMLNDKMEAALVARVFGDDLPASSTKRFTGHTLGAAGAIQSAISLIGMEHDIYPPHVWDGVYDPELAAVRLAQIGEKPAARVDSILTLNFAFGGSNAVLAWGRA